MHRQRLLRLVVALGVLAGCTGREPAARPACPTTPVVGVHQDLGYEGDEGARRAAIRDAAEVLHAGISRSSLLWDQVEPRKGRRDWSRYDRIVAGLEDHGVEVLLVFVGSPAWATGGGRFDVPADDRAFATWASAYADFAGAAAARYRGRVRWEVWNEPNSAEFWSPRPDPVRYATLFQAVQAAVLRSDPAAQVASGGVNSLTRPRPGSIAGREFLAGLHEAGVDPEIVALHPYPDGERPPASHVAGANNVDDVGAVIADLRARTGRPSTIWVTELGWDRRRVGEDAQAAGVRDALVLLAGYPEVSVVVVFIDRDRPQYPFGLLAADGRVTAAGRAFAATASTLSVPCPAAA